MVRASGEPAGCVERLNGCRDLAPRQATVRQRRRANHAHFGQLRQRVLRRKRRAQTGQQEAMAQQVHVDWAELRVPGARTGKISRRGSG
jgi:hypothetical protein